MTVDRSTIFQVLQECNIQSARLASQRANENHAGYQDGVSVFGSLNLYARTKLIQKAHLHMILLVENHPKSRCCLIRNDIGRSHSISSIHHHVNVEVRAFWHEWGYRH